MSYQRNSWYDRRGRGRGQADPIGRIKGLVGQIYFPTDKHKVDLQDAAVLDRLVRDVSRTSRRKRVELAMVGHADHRGSSEYNENLAKKRADAVLLYVLKRVPAQYFNAYSAVSQGERHALQNVSGDRLTGFDRRVDIYNSFAVEMPAFARVKAVPRVMRMIKRVFLDVKGTMAMDSASPPDPISDLIDLTAEIIGALDESSVRGSERVASRHYRSFDARHRINAVSIDEVYRYQLVFGGDLTTWTTTITYEWGPPRRVVAVTHRKFHHLPGDSAPRPSAPPEKSLFRRSRVEPSPLLNPAPVKNVKF